MKGFRRILGVKRTKKAPLHRDDLKRIFSTMADPTHPISVRDGALLLVGFAGGFRRSELAALDVEDVRFTDEGMVITVRRSKTDQEGAGREVAICRGGRLCPVKALRGWLALAEISQGPIFRSVHWRGTVHPQRISGGMIIRLVKKYAAQIGKQAASLVGTPSGAASALRRLLLGQPS